MRRNMHQSVLWSLILSLFILGGWMPQTNQALLKKIAEIDRLVNQQRWDRVVTETNRLEQLYKKEKWKIQLLGDEREFEEVEQEINQLKAAVREQSRTETKLLLASIHSLLNLIYSM